MIARLILALVPAALLAACGGGGDAAADQLDNAAAQSDPAAAAVMANEADALRANGTDDVDAAVQQAMDNAGAAQANGAAPGGAQ